MLLLPINTQCMTSLLTYAMMDSQVHMGVVCVHTVTVESVGEWCMDIL